MRKYLIAVFCIYATGVSAQTGIISGKIQSNDGRKIADVMVYAQGSVDTAFTDIDGVFHLKANAGLAVVNFEAADFDSQSDTVNVVAGSEIFLNKIMLPIQLKEVGKATIRVARRKAENTVAGAIQSKQLATQMIEVVSAEDFKKTNIRTTSDAIKRIPGATIMEGKFANIRGMYDRYNAGYLNGAPLPSTESDRKAFSFDIIPANLLDNIVVIKSGTPDLIGDFGGGIIRINTKSIPTKMTQNITLGFQYNSITSFKNVEAFTAPTSEYFGILGSNRSIPDLQGNLAKADPQANATESHKFNNDWSIKTMRPMPTPRFAYTIGVPFKLPHRRELGLLVSLNYGSTQKYSDGKILKNDLGDNRVIADFSDRLFTSNVQNGGVMNLSYKFNSRNRIDWKNLYTLNYDNSSTFRTGISDVDNNLRTEGYANLINYNRLASTQLNGTHVLGKNQTTVTWLVNYGSTHRSIPDYRIATYSITENGDRYLIKNDFFNVGSGRFFSDLGESTLSASADIQHNFKTGKLTTNLKYGGFYQHRQRSFVSHEFVYGPVGKSIKSNNMPATDLADNKIAPEGLYLVEKSSPDLDQYTGTSQLNAGFVMLENNYPLFMTGRKANMLKVIYGVRFEQFSQIIKNDIFTRIYKKDVSNTGTTNDFLPSINIIAPVTGKTGFRAAYYKTVNRPEMRELAKFAFYNFNLNSEILGNPLITRAVLHNYDIRYEIFPGKEDMLSLGGFAKQINNPIEFSLDPTQPQIRTFTYRNEKSAFIQGIELEIRKNLSFAGKLFAPKFFKNLSFYGNLSLIKSKVKFAANSTSIQNRPLQGQSPYVINASLFYENASAGWSFAVNFNKIGSRIAYIGVPAKLQPFGMDIYEFGRSILDLQLGKNIGKNGNLRVTAGDLLAQNTVFYQDLNGSHKYEKGADNTLFSFTNGRTVTVSYSYNF